MSQHGISKMALNSSSTCMSKLIIVLFHLIFEIWRGVDNTRDSFLYCLSHHSSFHYISPLLTFTFIKTMIFFQDFFVFRQLTQRLGNKLQKCHSFAFFLFLRLNRIKRKFYPSTDCTIPEKKRFAFMTKYINNNSPHVRKFIPKYFI